MLHLRRNSHDHLLPLHSRSVPRWLLLLELRKQLPHLHLWHTHLLLWNHRSRNLRRILKLHRSRRLFHWLYKQMGSLMGRRSYLLLFFGWDGDFGLGSPSQTTTALPITALPKYAMICFWSLLTPILTALISRILKKSSENFTQPNDKLNFSLIPWKVKTI